MQIFFYKNIGTVIRTFIALPLGYIRKGKELGASKNKGLNKVILQWSIMENYMNHGDGIREKILLNKL